MKSPKIKKLIIGGGALVALLLIVCGLTGCNWFGNDSKGNNSSVSQNSGTPIPEIPGLPPDPGEAGKATLAGIITNSKGIRDDIYRYIMINYQDSEKTREVLFQYAKQMQNAILDASSKELSMKHADEYGKSLECGVSILGFDKYYKIEKDLKPMILNTEARTMAYLQYDDQLGGEVFPDNNEGVAACDFNTATLSN